jgi:hypothetical protein
MPDSVFDLRPGRNDRPGREDSSEYSGLPPDLRRVGDGVPSLVNMKLLPNGKIWSKDGLSDSHCWRLLPFWGVSEASMVSSYGRRLIRQINAKVTNFVTQDKA